MICTTPPTNEGKAIREYKGIVFGEVVAGVDLVKDFAAGITNFLGGRSGSYEDKLQQARDATVAEMEQCALKLGANAVVGVDIDYEVLGSNNGMLMVSASGRVFQINPTNDVTNPSKLSDFTSQGERSELG